MVVGCDGDGGVTKPSVVSVSWPGSPAANLGTRPLRRWCWTRCTGCSPPGINTSSEGVSPLIELPPYSPELNPAERVIEEVRRWIEGRVYSSIEDKVEAVEEFLSRLESDPHQVRALTGWDWIEEAIQGFHAHIAA